MANLFITIKFLWYHLCSRFIAPECNNVILIWRFLFYLLTDYVVNYIIFNYLSVTSVACYLCVVSRCNTLIVIYAYFCGSNSFDLYYFDNFCYQVIQYRHNVLVMKNNMPFLFTAIRYIAILWEILVFTCLFMISYYVLYLFSSISNWNEYRICVVD